MSTAEMSSPPAPHRNLNLAYFVIHSWATSLEVFLHGPPGSRYMGTQALAVLLLVPVYTLFWQGYNVLPLMYFLGAYLVKCFLNRVGRLNLALRGEHCHSYYTGRSYLMPLAPQHNERQVKLIMEPAFTGFFGYLICSSWNQPLGWFLIIGSVCMFLAGLVCELRDRAQAQNLHDATIEQQMAAERFRAMRGE